MVSSFNKMKSSNFILSEKLNASVFLVPFPLLFLVMVIIVGNCKHVLTTNLYAIEIIFMFSRHVCIQGNNLVLLKC